MMLLSLQNAFPGFSVALTCRIIETVLFLSRDPLSRKSRARATYAFAYMSENVF